MEEELKCPICFTLAETPYESNCCGNIFCDLCVSLLKKNDEYYKCPICRKNVTFRESSFAKRLLTNLVVNCSYKCGESLLFHKMKLHLKTCPEREFQCKIDEKCRFKAKKDEFLQHIVSAHTVVMLNVAENFVKVKEYFPELDLPANEKKAESKIKLREDVNEILNEYNFNRDSLSDPYDINYNYAVSNIDRSFYRNYLFRRRLLNSESSHIASVHENEDVSVQSENRSHNHSYLDHSANRKPEASTTQNKSTNLFKYYYNEFNETDPATCLDSAYNKFDPNTADEEDYKNLYQQLVSQNRILKSEILDKIKKSEDNNLITFQNSHESNENMIEEEKDSEGEKAFFKGENKLNLANPINQKGTLGSPSSCKELTMENSEKNAQIEKSSSLNTISSLCLNIDNKVNI